MKSPPKALFRGYALAFVLLLSGAFAHGQTSSNIDDNTVGVWGGCGISCAGGLISGTGTLTFGNTPPSLDGGSALLTLTCPSGSAGQTCNWLEYWHGGPNNSATTFTGTWHVNIPSIALIKQNEFDLHLFAGGHRWFWGFQCAPGGVWDIWDELHQAWIVTAVPCTLTAATFHTIIEQVHRVPGDTSCSGQPCDYYDHLIVDGVDVAPGGGFPPQPSGPTALADDAGMDTQIDLTNVGGTASEFIDQMSFIAALSPTTSVWGSGAGSGTFTIGFSMPGTGAGNLYCPTSGVPTWGVTDGPAALPTACYNTALANTPSPGTIHAVHTSVDLTNCTTSNGASCPGGAVVCGDIIQTDSGATYTGSFTWPALACDSAHYVTLRPSGYASLPAEGTRTSPCYSGVTSLPNRPAYPCPPIAGTYTSKIIGTGTTPTITFQSGTSYVRFFGEEITRALGAGYVTDILFLSNVGNVDHVILDRNWIHGDEQQDETNAGIRLSAASYVAIIDNYFNNFYCLSGIGSCTDSKAIGGGINVANSTPESVAKIVNNFLEAAGENIITGGAASNTTPTDWEIRLNSFFKNPCWNPSAGCFDGGVGGHAYIVKNLMEFKNINRILIQGNTYQNTWGGFSQPGEAWTFTAVNQPVNLCPVCMDANITARENTINSANTFMELSIVNETPGVNVAAGEHNISVHDNVADNLGYCQPVQCPTSESTVQMISYYGITNPAQVENNVSVVHNTLVAAPSSATNSALGLSGPTIASGAPMSNVTFANNVLRTWTGTTNAVGSGVPANCANSQSSGTNMLNACWSPKVFTGNCFVSNGAVSWPAGNVTSVASYAAVFTSYSGGNGGNYVLAAGACKGAGNDGLDPGANITQVASVIAGNHP